MKAPSLSAAAPDMTVSNQVTLSSQFHPYHPEENPFAEYMWMENEEEFNRQVEEELWEEDFIERCFQEMLDEEEWEWFIPSRDLPPPHSTGQLTEQISMDGNITINSSLNPNAKEFTLGIHRHVM